MTNETDDTNGATSDHGVSIAGSAAALKLTDPQSLRAWWHTILRNYGRYPCYAIFLILASDTDALLYLKKYNKELQSLSGSNCLVLALSEKEFRVTRFAGDQWYKLLYKQSSEGYSVQVARLFNIDFTQFPCLLIFDDIRSPDCVIVKMAKKDVNEINQTMRAKFSIIQKAVSQGKDPLDLLEHEGNVETIRGQGKIVMGKVGSFTEKTLESIVDALVNAVIK
ncbi:MAG: hypothetical protein HYZ49_03275 [Chloroflexi bacterium]|nr:hypothetical protein [Chloroflexota bacterium]